MRSFLVRNKAKKQIRIAVNVYVCVQGMEKISRDLLFIWDNKFMYSITIAFYE